MMPRKKVPKSEKLPKFGTAMRSLLVSHLCEFEDYQNNLNKGIRLFTNDELKQIKERYEKGLTWEDIDRELSHKGIPPLRKATFRKYIQNGYLPRAMSYRKTDKGRMAVFPPDTISHINFIQYFYRVASGEIADDLLTLIKNIQITYLEAVESKLTWRDNLYASILHYICFYDNEAHAALAEGLSSEPEDKERALRMLEEADSAFSSQVEPKIRALIRFLESKSLFPTDLGDDKEDDNEANKTL